ncbi:MAG: hypothetical protein M3304_06055 [Actinomycetota bacterium]|nr:hypothetical protein [Actinomycetota bacterium]
MIVSFHVATGACFGAALRSRSAALLLGPLLHVAGDRIPHEDIDSRRFEIGSGVLLVALLAARRGLRDPATLGALATTAPDGEHVLPTPRVGGRKLFPSHRFERWHRVGGVSAPAQLLAAGVLLGCLLAPRRR